MKTKCKKKIHCYLGVLLMINYFITEKVKGWVVEGRERVRVNSLKYFTNCSWLEKTIILRC